MSVRAVAEWIADPTFPGRPATPGRRNGWFPFDRIDAWLERKGKATKAAGDGARELDPLTELRLKRDTLRYNREAGQVVDLASARQAIERQIAVAKSILDPLPDRFAALVPQKAGEAVRTKVATLARRTLSEAYAAIAETLLGDTDSEQT